MQEIIDFLRLLSANNNREWFNANKDMYRRVNAQYQEFAAALLDGIASFDDTVRALTVADCTYRIYRDTRFSPDKTPYKTHMGVYIVQRGKCSGYAGYYLHIDPGAGHFLYAGLHMPEPPVLRSVREEIVDNGDALMEAVAAAKGFHLLRERELKRNPKDFPAGHKYDDLLRLKDFGIERPLSEKELLAPDMLKRAVACLRTTKPMVDILNRAVQYAYDEMADR